MIESTLAFIDNGNIVYICTFDLKIIIIYNWRMSLVTIWFTPYVFCNWYIESLVDINICIYMLVNMNICLLLNNVCKNWNKDFIFNSSLCYHVLYVYMCYKFFYYYLIPGIPDIIQTFNFESTAPIVNLNPKPASKWCL